MTSVLSIVVPATRHLLMMRWARQESRHTISVEYRQNNVSTVEFMKQKSHDIACSSLRYILYYILISTTHNWYSNKSKLPVIRCGIHCQRGASRAQHCLRTSLPSFLSPERHWQDLLSCDIFFQRGTSRSQGQSRRSFFNLHTIFVVATFFTSSRSKVTRATTNSSLLLFVLFLLTKRHPYQSHLLQSYGPILVFLFRKRYR